MSQDQPSPEPVKPELPETLADTAADAPLEQVELEQIELEQMEPLVQAEPLAETRQPTGEAPPRPVTASTRSTPAHRTPPANDEILPQTLLRLLGDAIVAAQPPLKQQGIKALRGTIGLLENAVERLEAEPAPKAARRAPAPETTSENALPPSSNARTGRLAPLLSTKRLREKFQTSWRQLQRSWRGVLRQLRDRLPTAINRNWSDQALTGAIVGLAVLTLWTTSTLLPDQSQPSLSATPPAETVAPSPTPTLTPTPAPTLIPPLVKAPEAPKPVEISPPPIAPSLAPPPLKLTPQQPLIAQIQKQVAAISDQYANGLVESIQANFRSSRLIVHISDRWYGLSRSQQDKLAGELLTRTQGLDFSKLELVDSTGRLLARSPVVGSEIIILKRSNALPEAG